MAADAIDAKSVVNPLRTPSKSAVLDHWFLAVLIVAWAARVLCLGGVSLIITNDSTEYIANARWLVSGHPFEWSFLRTPGYAYFLSAVFSIFGEGPVGVLVAQHAMGIAMAAIAWVIGRHLGIPRIAAVVAIVLAIDPYVLALETYALSETLTIFLLVAAICVAVVSPRERWWPGIILGVVLAAGCLVRPAMQVFPPFLILGWALRTQKGGRRVLLAMLIATIACGATLAPWLTYNARRGVYGLARGFETFQWIGVSSKGLLTDDFPLDPALKAAYDELGDKRRSVSDLVIFVYAHEGFTNNAKVLGAWAKRSIRKNFGGYVRAAAESIVGQLNIFDAGGGRLTSGEMNWYLSRTGESGTNNQFEGTFETAGLKEFAMDGSGGAARAAFAWLGRQNIVGIPQGPLFVLTAICALICAFRRDWCFALIAVSVLIFVILHGCMLVPWNRYSLPMQPAMYVATIVLCSQVAAMFRKREPPPPVEQPNDAAAAGAR